MISIRFVGKRSVTTVCLLCFSLLVLTAGHSALALDGVDCSIASEAVELASRVRGLRIIRRVPCKLQNRSEVENYLRQTIKTKITEQRVEQEGRAYRLLGFIPKDYDYLNGVIKLYTDQLGGYYEPEKEYYAMAAWMPMAMQMPIAVHELTHALQDQHYDLDTLTSPEGQVSDALLARTALIEGDATSVMIDYSRELIGQPPLSKQKSVSSLMLQNISGAMFSPSLREAPPALQAALIFPYVSGLRFAHELLLKGGYRRIDKAFADLPTTTEEVLHPEKYFAKTRDYIDVKVPEPPVGVRLKKKEAVFTDRLGEFLISTLLGTWLSPMQASIAAAGWGGDRLALYDLENNSRGLLVWEISWDSNKEAKEFFDAFSKAYAIRFKVEAVRTASRVSFIDRDFGPVRISLDGRLVRVVVGG